MPHKLKVDNHYTVIGFIYCQIFREIQPRQSFLIKKILRLILISQTITTLEYNYFNFI